MSADAARWSCARCRVSVRPIDGAVRELAAVRNGLERSPAAAPDARARAGA